MNDIFLKQIRNLQTTNKQSNGNIIKCVIATQDPNGNHIIAEMPKLKWRRFVRWVKSFLPNSDQPKKD